VSEFNDHSYYWDRYCWQLARSIALAERKLIIETLGTLRSEGEPISATSPRFHSLITAAEVLRARGHRPNTLFAPVGLFVPFADPRNLTIDWNTPPREVLVLPTAKLQLFWSSGGAPLDRFVMFDSTKAVWRVKLDPESKKRLTVAIGESRTEAGEEAVVFLAETVAKLEIEDPSAYFVIPLDGEPLDAMEYVNQEAFKE
jgi:hypothetical protein